ncbi:type IX secretion system periplasmic lipoprotein PorW/SprE [Tenacibaculum maritimum]|uniref:type IX secretion system periplasmic lipoprotein PorW/SprE n=1 Tax=Tenacibaculum maritimum TaxID=107401 RepID=UPI0012E539FC|nr:tetratricopeptide repeat protein [Tenacibaculum maritimum]CAA0211493.1 T9SS lipoprotein precursor sprE [Tenacibaculum maritimum]
MKKLLKIFVLALLFVVVYSCGTRKDTFINRNFHALTTKYNVLFNGEQAYLQGLKEVNDKHQDNYWKRLQIEPITFNEKEIAAPVFNADDDDDNENKAPTPFEKAEEKAVKAVQKHSMNINGYEKNRQIDDAYFLLGKSRYYTQRFIPAIEAFNYIISNYPNANLINQTKIWRAKTNIRLDNEKLAIESLKLLIHVDKNEKELPDAIKEEAHTAMAMAYEKTDTIQKVIKHLTKATRTRKNKEQAARNLFVLGQIYSQLDRKDSARMVFKKLADFKKAPRKYRIHANIELVKNFDQKTSSTPLIRRLEGLIQNIDNRKFLHELYYQIATLEENRDSMSRAIKYYQKSLAAKNNNDYQKTFAYEKLGNISFDKGAYLKAGAYYDSVLKVTPKEFLNEKRIRRIARKNRGLTTLKKYEDIVKNNDSILQIVSLSEDERIRYFESYIEKLKLADKERQQQLLNSQNFGNAFGGASSISNNNAGKWYFYSSQTKAFGSVEFKKTWGNRPLEDNWRWSEKATINSDREQIDATNENQKKYDVSTYLEKIPKDQKEINNLISERNDALYQLGLIYKEQFKNAELAIQNLEKLNDISTDKNLELPITYHLYQIYLEKGLTEKADAARNIILKKYPETTFAQIIQFPNKKVTENQKDATEITKKYKELYYLYKENKFEEVVNGIENLSTTSNNSNLIPKLALLKALSIGKYKDKETYKKALNFVALSYANTEEGKKAQEIIERLNKK